MKSSFEFAGGGTLSPRAAYIVGSGDPESFVPLHRPGGRLSAAARLRQALSWCGRHWGEALVLAVMLLVALFAFRAFAQSADVAAVSTQVDVAPLLQQLILGLGAIVAALAVPIANHMRAWFKAKTGVEVALSDQVIRNGVDMLLSRAVKFATESVESADWTKIETRSQLVAAGANYFIEAAPGYLKKFGWDRAWIEKMILSRVYDVDEAPGNWTGAPAPVPAVAVAG